MWEYCVDRRKKRPPGNFTPADGEWLLSTKGATEQHSLIISRARKRLMQDSEESRGISNKHILGYTQAKGQMTANQNNNNSFHVLLRVELFLSLWPGISKCTWGYFSNCSPLAQGDCRCKPSLKVTQVLLFPKLAWSPSWNAYANTTLGNCANLPTHHKVSCLDIVGFS